MSSARPFAASRWAPRARTWSWPVGLASLAYLVRLTSVLRGGGLYGRIGYDGSVYYASASALTRGLLPYQDFLLLHPPGVVLALLPFAALGRVVGDADAFALARLAWFGLGAVSTALVLVIVRRHGTLPAVVAAGAYAVFVPAVVSEHTTSLEAVGSVCLLGAIALLTQGAGVAARPTSALLGAGALLGAATGTKIWGVAVVVAVVGWTWRRAGARRAGLVLLGAAGACVAVCLPFFVAAPGPMWRMVVLDQLGRTRVSGSFAGRVTDVVGLSGLRGVVSTRSLAVVAVVLLLGLVVLSLRDPLGRLGVLLLGLTGAVLLATPSWSLAYTGLAAPPLALLVGCATAGVVGLARDRHRAVADIVVAALVGYAVASLPGLTFGSPFPGRSLERVVADVPGCVTTDDPIALIETGALQRNLAHGCPPVVDLSGYSYDLRPAAGQHLSRARNAAWQRLVRDHLASGTVSVVVRFRSAPGLSRSTQDAIARWPVVAEVDGYVVRRPEPLPAGAGG